MSQSPVSLANFLFMMAKEKNTTYLAFTKCHAVFLNTSGKYELIYSVQQAHVVGIVFFF